MSIFVDQRFPLKKLHILIALDQNNWDSITIVVAFDSLYNNFSTITNNMLKRGDKIIDEI